MLPYRNAAEVWKQAARRMVNPPRGITCPEWPTFNAYTGGLRPNEITLLCAPTGAGKTQFLANVAAQMLSQGVPMFAAPVETGDTDFLARLAAVVSGRDVNNGDPVDPQFVDRLGRELAESGMLKNLYLATYDNRVEVEEMLSLLKYMQQGYGIKVALLDNLNFFLKVTSSQMERAEMDNAMHEFVMLVKKLPIHVILIVHPKKTDGGRVESEFDIKGSSTAVQEAYNVCLFNRPKQQDVDEGRALFTDREMVFRKIRMRGLHVGKVIRFGFSNGRYEEYA